MMLLDDIVRDRKPKPGACVFAGDEGVEYFGKNFRVDARPGIFDGEANFVLCDQTFRLNNETPTGLHHLDRVEE